VLVAISIPIFTGQLKKARLATNQANARAAYAATTQYMLDTATTAKDGNTDYTYSTSKGQIDTTATAGTTDISTAAGLDISKWTTDEASLGDKTYTVWTVTIDANGTVTAYKAS
jgi:type II secretory pathway pseudopilin PulG